MENIKLELYAVKNSDGKFFRAKGYGGGNTWVDDINKAKIYGKIGGARGTVTYFAKTYPEYPTPQILKLTVTGTEIMDETERIKKVIQKKLQDEANRDKYMAEQAFKLAKRDFDNAEQRLKQLGLKKL